MASVTIIVFLFGERGAKETQKTREETERSADGRAGRLYLSCRQAAAARPSVCSGEWQRALRRVPLCPGAPACGESHGLGVTRHSRPGCPSPASGGSLVDTEQWVASSPPIDPRFPLSQPRDARKVPGGRGSRLRAEVQRPPAASARPPPRSRPPIQGGRQGLHLVCATCKGLRAVSAVCRGRQSSRKVTGMGAPCQLFPRGNTVREPRRDRLVHQPVGSPGGCTPPFLSAHVSHLGGGSLRGSG